MKKSDWPYLKHAFIWSIEMIVVLSLINYICDGKFRSLRWHIIALIVFPLVGTPLYAMMLKTYKKIKDKIKDKKQTE